jgi:hypothetical protein
LDTSSHKKHKNQTLRLFYEVDSIISLGFIDSIRFDSYKLYIENNINDSILEYTIEHNELNIAARLFYLTNVGLVYFMSYDRSLCYKLYGYTEVLNEEVENISLIQTILLIDSILIKEKGPPPDI